MLIIRNEKESERRIVEEVTRKAFWNMYQPGCDEHYLIHIMREHEDFIPELDFVAELDGEIIGNMMYTRAKLIDEVGTVKNILTFGPVSILPEYQRCGYGKQMIEHSFEKARKMGYDTIVICGSPANYVSRGFKSCKKFNVCMEGDSFPAAMMVKELVEGALDGRKWYFYDSPLFQVDAEAAAKFDEDFEPMEKGHSPSQEEFYILSNAQLK